MEKESDQQYSLYFDNYQRVLSDSLNDFLRRQVFVNVTLVCAGETLKAHQSILSACSPLFERILTDRPDTHHVVIFNDISKEEMVALLEYMYRGQVNVSKTLLPALLKAAKNLQIRGLEHEENNNSQEPSPQFGTNGYHVNNADPELLRQQEHTQGSSTRNSPAPLIPNIFEVRNPEEELPPTIVVPTATENLATDVSVKVKNPFAKKWAEDSDTTFCEDELGVAGSSMIATAPEVLPQSATKDDDDSDIEFIENNPSVIVIPETQQDVESSTPPCYRKTEPRTKRRVKREKKKNTRSLDEVEYTSDDSDLQTVSKKPRKNPVTGSYLGDEQSRVLVNPLALRSKVSKKDQKRKKPEQSHKNL